MVTMLHHYHENQIPLRLKIEKVYSSFKLALDYGILNKLQPNFFSRKSQ
jgi:hypothetical protein